MIWVDWAILAIISLSALISVMRGFVREALSLAGWIAAFLLAKAFYEPVAELLIDHIDTNSIRLGVAWVGIFVIVLFIAGVANYLIGKMIDKAGLSGTDRFLGMGFGALRGVLIVALIVLGLKQFTPVPKDEWWGKSAMIPHMELVAEWFYDKLGDVVDVPELKPEETKQEAVKATLEKQIQDAVINEITEKASDKDGSDQ
ncbi:CvpA family protein [Kangiella sp. HZ709]|uniref:CvpA family protein n=1 Tax=Kangiella sp. HZ709 TaxID=2666328 RepID=UPI0012B15219|nr:CvpA family protein [Kangiella sp. HZ709]MRX26749.1 CvpA family protein [Kangiella sp. HZ709]